MLIPIHNAIEKGDFTWAKSELNKLKSSLSLTKDQEHELDFEFVRMDRIAKEFKKDRTKAFSELSQFINDLTEEEFNTYDSQGLLEKKSIDGKELFFDRAARNLFYKFPKAKERLEEGSTFFLDKAVLYRPHPHHSEVISKVEQTKSNLVLPKKISIHFTLSVDANAIPEGELVKAWLPFPRNIEGRQEHIVIDSTSQEKFELAPESALQRTIYFEKPSVKDEKTIFSVSYTYESFANYVPMLEENSKQIDQSRADLKPFLEERFPHIRFTEELKAKSKELIGDETNPLKKAKILFEYVDKIPWASAREYSTIPNLSEYAFKAGHSDCGQQTMLLMTLFRMNGIPIKWQSGWEFSPSKFATMHDWAMAYFEPYGWVPVDVTHGKLISDNPAIEWFYLGGMDSYRLIFNDDYSQEFIPAKKEYRSETVDSQRGEVEWSGGNIYFDKWSYEMAWMVKDIN